MMNQYQYVGNEGHRSPVASVSNKSPGCESQAFCVCVLVTVCLVQHAVETQTHSPGPDAKQNPDMSSLFLGCTPELLKRSSLECKDPWHNFESLSGIQSWYRKKHIHIYKTKLPCDSDTASSEPSYEGSLIQELNEAISLF